MRNAITVSGLVATTPRHLVTQEGMPITSFRLAETGKRWDRARKVWVDDHTNWYTITSFHQLAINVKESVGKGDRIIVTGDLRVRDWDNGERAGTSVEIEAEMIGHDMCYGTSAFARTVFVKKDLPTNPEDEASCGCKNCERPA